MNDSGAQGSLGDRLSQPNVKLGLGIAVAVLVGIPLLYSWGWVFDRMATTRAIGQNMSAGDKALEGGDSVKALIAFNHARELRPSDPRLERAVWRARARFLAENADRVTLENLEESRYQVEQLLGDDPKNPIYLVANGHILEKRGDNAGADASLLEAVKADPKNVVARLARAAFLQKTTNKIDEVVEQYNAVLQSNPRSFAALFGLGRMYLVKKDTDKEIEQYKKALEVDKKSYVAWEALADAYLHKGGDSLKDAFSAYTSAAALQPNNPEPHWGLGIIQSQAGNWAKAEGELRMAMKGKRYPEMEFQLGLAVARQNRCNEALPLFLQFLREEPGHAAALYEVGACAVTLGQKDTARQFWSKLLEQPVPAPTDPRRAEVEKRNALVRARLGQLGPVAAAAPARGR